MGIKYGGFSPNFLLLFCPKFSAFGREVEGSVRFEVYNIIKN